MISAIFPWSAAGPGWTKSGLTVRYVDGAEQIVYYDPREMGGETLALFPHFLSMYMAIQKEVEAGRHKVKKRRKGVANG